MVSKYPGLITKKFDKRVVVIGRDNDRDQIDFEIKLLKEAAQREKELEAAKRRQEQAEQKAAKQAAWNRRIAGYHRLLSAFRQHEQEASRAILGLSNLPGNML